MRIRRRVFLGSVSVYRISNVPGGRESDAGVSQRALGSRWWGIVRMMSFLCGKFKIKCGLK